MSRKICSWSLCKISHDLCSLNQFCSKIEFVFFSKIIAYLKHLEPFGFSHQNSWTFELKDLLIILCEIAHNLCPFNQFCLKIEFVYFFENNCQPQTSGAICISNPNSWKIGLKYLFIILCEIAYSLWSFNQFC